jgi:hypothetical protein
MCIRFVKTIDTDFILLPLVKEVGLMLGTMRTHHLATSLAVVLPVSEAEGSITLHAPAGTVTGQHDWTVDPKPPIINRYNS